MRRRRAIGSQPSRVHRLPKIDVQVQPACIVQDAREQAHHINSYEKLLPKANMLRLARRQPMARQIFPREAFSRRPACSASMNPGAVTAIDHTP